MNTTNDNSRAIAAMLGHLEYTLDHALKLAIDDDDAPSVLRCLNTGVLAYQHLLDKNLPEYLELAVAQESIHALGAILAYKPINPEHVLDLNRIITNEAIHDDIDAETHYTLLNYTIDYIHEDMILPIAQLLLEAGADPNIPCSSGYTPLHNAALARNPDLIYLLLSHQANPNMLTNNSDQTSCFECLLKVLIENLPEDGLPGEEIEDNVLACTPVFLEHHAEAHWDFHEYAKRLGFTRVLALVEKPKTYPIHIAASYMSKEAMIQYLQDSSFEYFELLDAHGNKPSNIARKYNQEDIIGVLENYEAMYNRRLLLKTNHSHSGEGLPAPIEIQRVNIASFITAQEFGFFTATTNMHIHSDDRLAEDIEHHVML
ncbi:MAG: ankyrin repeat domain-containing protein [Legionellaceae bacterium]|nr:ankyrin repeat domain-containing protein [Legionellaceae bacterium]